MAPFRRAAPSALTGSSARTGGPRTPFTPTLVKPTPVKPTPVKATLVKPTLVKPTPVRRIRTKALPHAGCHTRAEQMRRARRPQTKGRSAGQKTDNGQTASRPADCGQNGSRPNGLRPNGGWSNGAAGQPDTGRCTPNGSNRVHLTRTRADARQTDQGPTGHGPMHATNGPGPNRRSNRMRPV